MERNTINFFTECDFELENQLHYRHWLLKVIKSEDKDCGEINFIFCDDDYLYDINVQYLQHDTYTDIISFDNTDGRVLNGDIFISIERIEENASEYNSDFESELNRVMAHGILHFCGYKDKNERDAAEMRRKEDEKMRMFHVEQ